MSILKSIIKAIAKPGINSYKGRVGESKVNLILKSPQLNNSYNKLITNYYLLDNNGISHQIDHIYIRKNGIFCLETKNYKGVIVSNYKGEWYQVISSNLRYKLINPIKQNKTHIYHLSKLLDDKYKIHSLIVMVNNNSSNIDISNVINLKDLELYLTNFFDGTNLKNEEIDYIYKELLKSQSKITEKQHIENIKKNKINKYKD